MNGHGRAHDGLEASSVLLVTAHPDDESMFFAPTLAHVLQRGAEVHILCLSTGSDTSPSVREQELLDAAVLLKVPPGNVTIIHDPRLLDGMDKAWVPAVVAHYVQQQLKQHPCDTVLTFDSYGVSGHINHKGTHEGVRQLLQSKGRALGVASAWALVSEWLPLKYSSVVSRCLVACCRKPGQQLVTAGRLGTSWRAMAAHSSQWAWFRKLFVLLSSYTYVNRLERMPTL